MKVFTVFYVEYDRPRFVRVFPARILICPPLKKQLLANKNKKKRHHSHMNFFVNVYVGYDRP